jgi:hypothetical protein
MAAQNIMAEGKLTPGISGQIYLTNEVYVTGVTAANNLGIPHLVEVGIEIPDTPPPPGLSSLTASKPFVTPAGIKRRGGGAERSCPGPIAIIEEGKWLPLENPDEVCFI